MSVLDIEETKAADLIEDFAVYPRNSVFDGHVSDLTRAIEAGARLPPIEACRRTRRIVDGFHRRRAWMRVNGAECLVPVVFRDFTDDAALVEEAMRLNAGHGRRLTAADFARCALLAERVGLSKERLAEALHLTRPRLADYVVKKTAIAAETEARVIVRRGMSHLAGRKLTTAQEAAAKRVGGQTALYHANQLISLIEADAVPTDEKTAERLQYLRVLLRAVTAGGGRKVG